MSTKRVAYVILFCLLAPALLGGCSAAGPKQGSIYKIGFNSSATGDYAPLGLPEAKTAEMIQKQINDQGGVTGPDGVSHEVRIILLDDADEADKAVGNVTRLITEDEVIAVASSTGNGTSVAQIPVCEENETACISMASAASITADPDTGMPYKWMFKTQQTNGLAGEWQAAYLKAKGITGICILSTSDADGKDSSDAYKAAAAAAGLTVSHEGDYAATESEFSAQMAGVLASGCQAVEIGSTPPSASLATVAVRNAMPGAPITLGPGACSRSFLATANQAAEGVVFPCGKVAVAARLSDDDPQKAVLQKYLSDYAAFTGGESADAFGGHGWDALKMIVGALQGLKNGMSLRDRRAAVRDYLETRIVDWPGISGTFTMSPTDHNGLTKESLLVVIVRDGKLVSFPESDW